MKTEKYKNRQREGGIGRRNGEAGNLTSAMSAGGGRRNGGGDGRRERVEGRERKDGRLPRKQHPRWYCDERKMVGLPFVWHRFLPHTEGIGVPIGGATVLVVARGWEGKVLAVPRDFLYDQTAELFQQHAVQWWSYMPEMPLSDFGQSRVLTCGDFFYYGRWDVGGNQRPEGNGRCGKHRGAARVG